MIRGTISLTYLLHTIIFSYEPIKLPFNYFKLIIWVVMGKNGDEITLIWLTCITSWWLSKCDHKLVEPSLHAIMKRVRCKPMNKKFVPREFDTSHACDTHVELSLLLIYKYSLFLSIKRNNKGETVRKWEESSRNSEKEKEGPSISTSLTMLNLPQSLSMNAPYGGSSSSVVSLAEAPMNKDQKMASAESLVLELINPDLRENALLELSKVGSFSWFCVKRHQILIWFGFLYYFHMLRFVWLLRNWGPLNDKYDS